MYVGPAYFSPELRERSKLRPGVCLNSVWIVCWLVGWCLCKPIMIPNLLLIPNYVTPFEAGIQKLRAAQEKKKKIARQKIRKNSDGGASRPLPRDGGVAELRGDPAYSWGTPQGLDQRSKMEEAVSQMTRRRSSDAEQSRKR